MNDATEAEARDAVQAQAHDWMDPEDGTVTRHIHVRGEPDSYPGWDLGALLRAMDTAKSIEWVDGMGYSHDLRVTWPGGSRVTLDVRKPGDDDTSAFADHPDPDPAWVQD